MTEQKYTTILVPVDGSKAAKLAFDRGVEIAKRNHSHLDVLNVIDLNQFTVSFAGMVMQAETLFIKHLKMSATT